MAPAEANGLEDVSVELVTVAQAAHWFDLDAFYAEVRRVLVRGGIVALWTYGSAWLDTPALSAALSEFEHHTVGPFWPAERRMIADGYRTIPFPFRELAAPPFSLEKHWTLSEVLGYAGTWSATARARDATGRDPIEQLEGALAPLWGPPDRRRTIGWPLALRIGAAGNVRQSAEADGG